MTTQHNFAPYSHGFDAYLYTPANPEHALQQIQQYVLHSLQLRIPQQYIMQIVQKSMQF